MQFVVRTLRKNRKIDEKWMALELALEEENCNRKIDDEKCEINRIPNYEAPATRTMPKWLSQEEDDDKPSEGCDGMQEPPATPVARDELALRRHRFFSDLLQAARNTTEHRVHFDPLGPVVHSG